MKRYLFLICGLFFSAISIAQTVNVPLNFVLPEGRDSTLRGQWDKISFPLTILPNQQVNNLKVSLSLTHSGNIDLAHLWVNLGEKPIASIQLQPNGESQQIVVNLSQALLKRYGNMMTISVRHQLPASLSLTEQRIEASEAVTEILAQQSYFELDYTTRNTETTLADLSALISSGQLHDHPVQLLSHIDDNSQLSLTIASQLVQGWTLRSESKSYQYQYVAGTESVSTSRIQLVYGLPKQLSDIGLLPDDYLTGIKGPYLGLVQSGHSGNWQLVVSGRNEQELLEATAYFANPDYPLPDHKYAVVNRYQQPEKNQLESKGEYTLSQFTPQQTFGEEPLVLPLMMPSNTLFSPNETAHINLVLAHPSVQPGEAAMVIRVNGDYANSMPLRASRWRETQHYRLAFPMNQLRPGLNKVSVELYGPEQIDSYSATTVPFIAKIEDSSAIRLGAWVNYLTKFDHQLPADQLLFLADNNGSESQVTLSFDQPSQLNAVWQLLSHLTHQARRPMNELLVTDNTSQQRPINLTFEVGNSAKVTTPAGQESDGLLSYVRHKLLKTMAQQQNTPYGASTQPAHKDMGPSSPASGNFYQYSTNKGYLKSSSDTDQLAKLTTANNGWRNIVFSAISEEALNQEMQIYLSQQRSSGPGEIELSIHSIEADKQLARSGFIAAPYSLPVVLLLLLLPLTLLIHRQLEKPL